MKHQSIKGNKICKALVLMLALALLLTTASIPAFAAGALLLISGTAVFVNRKRIFNK